MPVQFRDDVDAKMVLQVLADTRQIMHDIDPVLGQVGSRAI